MQHFTNTYGHQSVVFCIYKCSNVGCSYLAELLYTLWLWQQHISHMMLNDTRTWRKDSKWGLLRPERRWPPTPQWCRWPPHLKRRSGNMWEKKTLNTELRNTCAPTSSADRILIKPASGVGGRRRAAGKTDGASSPLEFPGDGVHHIRLEQLTPTSVSVQDNIVGLDLSSRVHLHVLVKTGEGDVFCVKGQVWSRQLHACSPGSVDGMGQDVDAVVDGSKEWVYLQGGPWEGNGFDGIIW